MKWICIITFMLSGCWTPPDFPMETITHTDAQGNYIGNIDHEDWVVRPFQPSSLHEIDMLTLNDGCAADFIQKIKFGMQTDAPVIHVYPNPTDGHPVFIDIVASQKVIFYINAYEQNQAIGGCGYGNVVDSSESFYTSRLKHVPMIGNYDTEYLLAFIMEDSSAFITKGDIKIIQ